MAEGYAKVKDAARWVGVSERTFRDWLKNGLPHHRLKTGTILVRYDSIDQWLSQFEVTINDVETLVDSVMEEFSNDN